MPQGRPATVRSHRRGGPRRRFRLAPWFGITLVLALLAGGLYAGYYYVLRPSCSGQVRVTIAASPSTATILQGLSRNWKQTEPSVGGKCASVDVSARDSAQMATSLGNEWDASANGAAPDVWVPQSTAWARRAASSALAEPMMPDLQPSIARTPTVIAMPRLMAEALGWPKTELSWQGVLDTFANKKGWADYGKEWGPFKFGMTDPAQSTAGLLALTAMLDANDDGEVDDAERTGVQRLNQVVKVYAESTDKIMEGYTNAGGQGGDSALTYLSAFPALEQDILTYNMATPQPQVPLVGIYPQDATIEADHPYLILNAPWSTNERKQAASAFLAYVRSPKGQTALLDAGFRDPNRRPGKGLTPDHGLTPVLTALPRAVLLPEAVTNTIQTWTGLTRHTNLLLVLDISGSMKEVVPGTGKTRLALAKAAAKKAVALFAEDARVGLWAFSTKQNGNRDFRTVVPIGRLGDELGDGRTRQQQMLSRIDGLQPIGDTGLYDTAAAAHDAMVNDYDKKAVNVVVLLTDGKNDDPGGGLSREQLVSRLRAAPKDKPVGIVTVAYGGEADFAVLRQISQLTGSRAFTAREEFDINQVLADAVFADN